ncbi:hypothetical protein E2C01_064456 [Portunus trituberculatus]|uniref:Uncharacterized protein n=1 Tax=Portunus trituberculatus TaxID=210409 RepID=A0A5B7HNT7_PORTR|nr:hypothetical protein [Portunus trituberculatus]
MFDIDAVLSSAALQERVRDEGGGVQGEEDSLHHVPRSLHCGTRKFFREWFLNHLRVKFRSQQDMSGVEMLGCTQRGADARTQINAGRLYTELRLGMMMRLVDRTF